MENSNFESELFLEVVRASANENVKAYRTSLKMF